MLNIFKKLSGQNSIKSAAVILIVTLFLSNILGLIRDHFLAQKIPTSMLDTYYAAFRIPDLIFNLLILGAITASFIPIFSKFLAKKNYNHAWRVANSFLNISALVMLTAMILLFFLMPTIIPWMVSKFDLEKQQTTIYLSRLLLISPFLFTLSYTFGSILNSFKRFFVYSLAPLFYNLIIIIATIFFADSYGVYAIVYGVLIGAFFHMLIQWIQLKFMGYKYQFILDWKNSDVRKIFYLMIPRAIGLGANQVMLVVYTAIASTLVAGSVAIFNLADNIQTMPTVVFGISFATAIFPTLAEHINLGKLPEFSIHIHKTIKTVAYILIPLTIAIILLRAQITRLILGSGYFGWDETIATYNTLAYFVISLFFQGLIPLFARAFYAMRNTKIPTIISIVSVIIGIILAYIFAPRMGVEGLALAFSVASIFNAITLYIILRKKVIEIKDQEKGILLYLGKIIFASAGMGTIIQLVKNISANYLDMARFWGVFSQALLAFLAGLAIYLAISKLIRLKQQEEILVYIKQYFVQHENRPKI